jgi:tripartite-type tricarboxylate transporter receptor subunit TctC
VQELRRLAHAAGLHDRHQHMQIVQLHSTSDAIAQLHWRNSIAVQIWKYQKIALYAHSRISYFSAGIPVRRQAAAPKFRAERISEAAMIKLPRRRFLQLAAGAAALPAVARTASAQAYPSRPITIIMPTGAGGPPDVVARIVVERMRRSLGQAVIIENVPGANGTLGIGRVARAKPDGYTLAFSNSFSTHVVNAAIYALPYDVINDFEPIALVTNGSQLIVARKALPANDLKGLIAWLSANPDKVSLGHTGPGSPAEVASIFFQQQTGTHLQFVTYRSAGQAVQDLIAGHIDLMITSPTIALAPVQAGSIKAYAVTARNRLTMAPDIPTVDEAGLPGLYTSIWYALWGPKGTPRDVIAKLNAAVMDALADPTVGKRLAELALEIFPREQQTPEALGAFQKDEVERWWSVLKEAGIKAQ